ncbi:MAG TPA: hypothetical protein VKN99_27175 [Polyangia bacterium]|nr:hypothetical protein [Polyangia bacterium]
MKRLVLAVVLVGSGVGGLWYYESRKQERVIGELRQRLDRLKADQLVADVAVLGQTRGQDGTTVTKLSFVEYKPQSGETLLSKSFDVRGEEFYIDALVVRFEDKFVEMGDGLRGTSVLLFRRAFGNQQKPDEGVPLFTVGDGHDPIPDPLKVPGTEDAFQRSLWARFWSLANDPDAAKKAGVRVAQGEAPHVLAKPHQVYQLTLRAAGGLEIKPRVPAPVQKEMQHGKK